MWLAAFGFGIVAGLALASKHPALLTGAAVFGACGLWTLLQLLRRKETQSVDTSPMRTRYVVSLLAQLLIAGIISLVTFYILNPAWWGDPVSRAGQVLDRRQQLLNEQVTY